MTGKERLIALINAVKYLEMSQIEGDIIECGVWKGGSMMAAALTLIKNDSTDRDLYLYDTFSGMTKPEDIDVSFEDKKAEDLFNEEWCSASLKEVETNLFSTDYPKKNLKFIKGDVNETIPNVAHQKIALLRLDTDWYQSTKTELDYLFPKLENGGILIIDDYGHWQGAKKAVDEYFKMNNIKIFLNRVDYTCRIGVKQSG